MALRKRLGQTGLQLPEFHGGGPAPVLDGRGQHHPRAHGQSAEPSLQRCPAARQGPAATAPPGRLGGPPHQRPHR
eukprot:8142306-Alexandrium_andersonii.AAC.1